MTLWHHLKSFVKDPPPEWVFELTEPGIAVARGGKARQIDFAPLEAGVLSVSPLQDNVLQPEALAAAVRRLAGESSNRKRRSAALILPDYCARLTVLDFDSFPAEPAEQASLVRFRIKKSVPYDVESAVLQYYPQPGSNHGKKLDVLVGLIPMELVARYEAPFRVAGFQPGFVTTSTLAALGLLPPEACHDVSLMAKLSGRVLTVVVLKAGAVRLVRCVELAQVTPEEVNTILYPTLAYVEDSLAAHASALYLCGFERLESQLRPAWERELAFRIELVESRYGTPEQSRAGLLGYLQSLEES